jgi:outer membrane protein TolC
VIKVTIKIETLKQDRVSLENEAAVIQARLAELMNLPAETRIGPVMPGPLPQTIPGPKTLAALARENRQELAALRFQIRRVQSMLEMSESMTEARFTTGLSYWDADHVNSAGTGALQPAFAEKTMASMKNNRPQTPWYGVDGPWVQQTRQTLAGLTHTLTARENATDRMVADAWADIDKLRRELALYQDRILPLTSSALEVSTREYEAGAIAFSQAIGSYTDWLSVKLTIARKTRDLGIALAVLESIVGNPL